MEQNKKKATDHRAKTSIFTETKNRLVIKQQNFKGGISNLYSQRGCNTQPKEYMAFSLPKARSNSKIDPATFLKEKLNSSVTEGLFAIESIRKKEHFCEARKEFVDLVNWLRNCLSGLQHISEQNEMTQQAVFEYLQKVYNACMSEIIQKTRAESTEKAALLEVIWQNILELLVWLDKYYRRRLTNEVHKFSLKCDEDSRRYLFTIEDLRRRVQELSKAKNKQDSFFYQVVKDNRVLRQRNHKLIHRLKYQLESNNYLKQENLKFYKENEKMKLVITQEGQTKQLEALARKLWELQSRLLTKQKITKNSILKEIKDTEVKQKLQEQIRIIVKRINQEDLLDLDYYQPPNVADLKTCYTNSSAQVQCSVESRATNTPIYMVPQKVEKAAQTQEPTLDYCLRVVCLTVSQQSITVKQKNVMRKSSKLSGCRDSMQMKINNFGKFNNTEVVLMKKQDDNPKTYEERVDKIAGLYENLAKVVDSLRMTFIAVPHHEKTRVKRETKMYATKALAEIKKLFSNPIGPEKYVPPDRPTRIKTSISESQSPGKKKRGSTSSNQGDELKNLLDYNEDLLDDEEDTKFGKNFLSKKSYTQRVNLSRKNNLAMQRTSNFRQETVREQPSTPTNMRIMGPLQKTELPVPAQQVRVKKLSQNRLSTGSVDLEPIEEFVQIISSPKIIQSKKISARADTPNKPKHQGRPRGAQDSPPAQSCKPKPSSQRSTNRFSSILRQNPNNVLLLPQQITAITRPAPKRRRSCKPYTITSNFQTRDDLVKFFEEAIADSTPLKSSFKSNLKVVKRTDSEFMEMRCGYADVGIKLDIQQRNSEHQSEVDSKDKKEVIMSILGRIEDAINSRDKDVQNHLKDYNGKEQYGRTMTKRLFNFLIREIYKQMDNILNKQCDFQTFLSQWILHRYGLDEICLEVISKVKSSVNTYFHECPQFKAMKVLMSFNKTQGKYFAKGLFRVFALFVQYGAENCELTKVESYCPNVDLSGAVEFVRELMSVFLGKSGLQQMISSLSVKYYGASNDIPPNKEINLFQLFLEACDSLESQSRNSQFSTLIKCLSDLVGSSTEQISLQHLLMVWSIINPNQSDLQKNILKLVKFCSINNRNQTHKLVIPVYKLTLLARRFSWRQILTPIDVVQQRYEKIFGQLVPANAASDWQLQRQHIYDNIKQYHQVMQLLDTRMIRYKVTSVLKGKPQPFPLLLYKLTKLLLCNNVYNEQADQFVDERLENISGILAQIYRKKEINALSRN